MTNSMPKLTSATAPSSESPLLLPFLQKTMILRMMIPFKSKLQLKKWRKRLHLLSAPSTKTLISWSLIYPLKTIWRCRSSLFRIHGPGWSFDFKDLHTAWDRHIITCLIAAAARGMPSPHLGSVLAAFLKKLAQIISNIVFPQNAEVPPPFLDNRIVAPEFWHAHLNCACRQATISQKGQERRLAGNQLCYWTSADADHCMKVTHLIVYLPPALGAYILQQHKAKGKIAILSADQTLLGEGTIAHTQQHVKLCLTSWKINLKPL